MHGKFINSLCAYPNIFFIPSGYLSNKKIPFRCEMASEQFEMTAKEVDREKKNMKEIHCSVSLRVTFPEKSASIPFIKRIVLLIVLHRWRNFHFTRINP